MQNSYCRDRDANVEGDPRSCTSAETTVYGKAVHQQQNLGERDHQEEDLDIDGGIILKLILKKQNRMTCLYLMWLGMGPFGELL